MNGGGDGIEETLVGVGREVDREGSGVRDGSGDFKIERDTGVSAAGIADGRIGTAIDGNGGDLGCFEIEALEKGVQVGSVVAAAKFEDADAIAGAIGAGGLIVGFGDLQRSVRAEAGGGFFLLLFVGIGVGAGRIRGLAKAEVSAGLRAVVEPKDAFDDTEKFLRNF